MPNEFYGDYAVTLPNIFPTIGEQMQYNQDRQDRIDAEEREMADRKAEREYQRQQQNRAYNLGQIDSKTAFDKFKVGQQAVDNYSLKKLDEVRNKALTEYVNLDPAEMQYRLNQDLQPLFQWDTMAKTGYQNLEKTLTELKKQNPSLNVSDAYDIAMSKFGEDYMKQTSPGVWEARNPIDVKETDYQSLFDDPDILGQITDDSSGLGEFIQGFKPQETENSEVKDNKGMVHSYAYTAKLTPFTEAILGDDGKSITRRIKSESVDMGGGNTIDVLPEMEYKAMISNPSAKAGLAKIWVDEKDKRAAEYIRKYKRPIDKNARDLMMREIAREQAKLYDISGIEKKAVDKTPKPPSININVGQQQRNQANELIDGITGAMRSGDEMKLKQLTSYLKRGNTPFKLEEAFFVPGSNKKKVAIQYYILDDKGKKKFKEKYFQADDPYLRDKIIAEYQQDMGSTVPVETLPYEQYLPNVDLSGTPPRSQQPSTKKKKYNPATGQFE